MLPKGRRHNAPKEDFACFAWTEKTIGICTLGTATFPFLLGALVTYHSLLPHLGSLGSIQNGDIVGECLLTRYRASQGESLRQHG